jgi:hypothetical protein
MSTRWTKARVLRALRRLLRDTGVLPRRDQVPADLLGAAERMFGTWAQARHEAKAKVPPAKSFKAALGKPVRLRASRGKGGGVSRARMTKAQASRAFRELTERTGRPVKHDEMPHGLRVALVRHFGSLRHARDAIGLAPALSPAQIQRVLWDRFEDAHRWKLSLLRAFAKKHGMDALRSDTVVAPGVRIGMWVEGRRRQFHAGGLAPWLRDAFEEIPGWSWDNFVAQRHRRNLAALRAFAERHGSVRQPWRTARVPHRLRVWTTTVRRHRANGALPLWLAKELDELPGWIWSPGTDERRERTRRTRLLAEILAHDPGCLRRKGPVVARTGEDLAPWIEGVRTAHDAGRLTSARIREMEAIPGWSWERMFARARSHRAKLLGEYAALKIDGTPLGREALRELATWLVLRRRALDGRGEISRWLADALREIPGWWKD